MLKEIIKKSPKIIRKPIVNMYNSFPDTMKYGRIFKQKYEFLQKSQWWSQEQHNEYQLREIQKIIEYSYENVPYYTRIFKENGISPQDIKDFSDLKRIPYLTKEIIQNNLQDLVSRKYKKTDIKYVTTGGSTGIPMGFYQDKYTETKIEWAYIENLWHRVGYDIGKSYKMAVIRENIPETGNYEYKGRNLILSSFNLTKNNMKEYIERIINFKPDFIQAFPSTISLLAKYIVDVNIPMESENLKAIICGSENLYDFQRELIEKAFKTRVYSFYGHTEHSCLAGECEESNFYHIQSEYGYVELIDSKGEYVLKEEELGEIVCTGFNNYVVPFIRYRTGDMAVNTNEKCKCGRNYRLIKKVDGRQQDYFIDKSGSKITFTCSDNALWQVKHKIYLYQYVQNEIGKVILCIQCKDEFSEEERAVVIKDFRKFYPQFDIELKFMECIERTGRGKFRYLVQNIKS